MRSLVRGGNKVNKPINPLREEYLAHIKKQKNSGLSIKKYCLEHDLIPHKFSYYQTYKTKTKVSPKQSSTFVSVKLKSRSRDFQKANKSSLEKPKVDPVWLGQFINSLLDVK